MPFKDRDTKLYAFVPVPISPSQNQLNNSAEEKTAPENQRPSVTAFCSPITSTLAYMSTKKDTSAVVTPTGYMSAPEFAAEKSNMVDRGDLTSPNTSTPKKMRPEGRAGVTSPIYRLSYTCGECLEEVADQGEFPGGAAICKNCSDVSFSSFISVCILLYSYIFEYICVLTPSTNPKDVTSRFSNTGFRLKVDQGDGTPSVETNSIATLSLTKG